MDLSKDQAEIPPQTQAGFFKLYQNSFVQMVPNVGAIICIPSLGVSRPGWMGHDQPGLVEAVPAHSRGLEPEDPYIPFQPKLSWDSMILF